MNEQTETEVQNMGENTSAVFGGVVQHEATKKMYTESPDYFANIIRNLLPPSEKPYKLLDLGSFKGEFLAKIIERMGSDYKFDTVGIDINKDALNENKSSGQKIVAPLEKLPLANHTADIAIMRLVLQWNTPEKQKEIIKELARVVKRFGIIQQVGPDTENPEEWREKIDAVLSGGEIPKLKRTDYYYPSRDEIEEWMKKMEINFQRLQDRKIEQGSDIFSERFNLSQGEIKEMKEILRDKDYFMQTTWVVYPSTIYED